MRPAYIQPQEGTSPMIDLFPYPRQCLWIDQGKIISFRTLNSSLKKDFKEENLFKLKGNDKILMHLARDISATSPTPGFSLHIDGNIFGEQVILTLQLKVYRLFSAPRTSGSHINHIGIDGKVWSDRIKKVLPLQLKAHVSLSAGHDRWSLTNCYLIGDEPKS